MDNSELIDVDEINQSIVDHLTNGLNSFCLGKYKNSNNFPVALGNVGYESHDIKTAYSIFYRMEKDRNKIMKYSNVMIRNIKVQEPKKRKTDSIKK